MNKRLTGRIHNLEDAGLLVLPLDVGCVALAAVVQQLLQKVPEQAAVSRRRLGVAAGSVLGRRGRRGGVVGAAAWRLGGAGVGGRGGERQRRALHAVLAVRVRGAVGGGGGGAATVDILGGGSRRGMVGEVEWAKRWRRRLSLLLGRVSRVERRVGRQRHRVGLRDEVRQVGKGLGGRGGQQGPVGGGRRRRERRRGRHEAARRTGRQRRTGEDGAGLTQQHLQDVVNDVSGTRASLRQVVLGQEAKSLT